MEPDISHNALIDPFKEQSAKKNPLETASGNRFFVCLGSKRPPIPWNPYDKNQKINLHTDYFGKAFIAMEEALEEGDWTIYLTWDLNMLPSYGERVIAVVLGDEWSRFPRYTHKVGMLFKCYGIGPELGCKPFRRPTYQNWLTFFQHLNARIQYFPGAILNWISVRKLKKNNKTMPPVYSIPLGYANQTELPLKPFFERKYDVSFAGSVVHKPYRWWSPKQWLQTPKSYSRNQMIEALKDVAEQNKAWAMDLKITPSYKAIRQADPLEYAQRVMETRISVAPRGTSFETFRFFEALRFGCIVITEYLPRRWFYDDAPVVRIENWHQLHAILKDLKANPAKMEALHTSALQWWESVCSEKAVGHFMASKLNDQSTRY